MRRERRRERRGEGFRGIIREEREEEGRKSRRHANQKSYGPLNARPPSRDSGDEEGDGRGRERERGTVETAYEIQAGRDNQLEPLETAQAKSSL